MTSDSFSSDDERYQALLQAHEEYLIQKNALDVQYDQQVKDLQKVNLKLSWACGQPFWAKRKTHGPK